MGRPRLLRGPRPRAAMVRYISRFKFISAVPVGDVRAGTRVRRRGHEPGAAGARRPEALRRDQGADETSYRDI